MKFLNPFFWATLTTLLAPISAKAIYFPEWERPIEKAQLTEIDAEGKTIREHVKKDLTLHRRDGSAEETSLTLNVTSFGRCETRRCDATEQVTHFNIIRTAKDTCQLATIEAESEAKTETLTMVDTRKQICGERPSAQWEITLTAEDGVPRTFLGDPKALMSIMGIMRQ